MDNKNLVKLGKRLAYILRHCPESANICLDSHGWAQSRDICRALNINMETLELIVSTDNKGRYVFDTYKKRIRAAQGHSINVDLELQETIPPDILYHGTARKNIPLLFQDGIQKMSRQYVHLSKDIETALNVGRRHGEPVIFVIDAKQMLVDGYKFYLSENNVWLTDYVPQKYISLFSEQFYI